MWSGLPRNISISAHDWSQVLTFQGKSCSHFRSYTHLVITTHQHAALKTSIRSHSDFWQCLRSSATFDSPNVCKIDISGHLPFCSSGFSSSRSHAPVGHSLGREMVTDSTGYQRPCPRSRARSCPFLHLTAITCATPQLTRVHGW